MIKIEITENSNPTTREVGQSKLLEQTAWAHLTKGGYPVEIRVSQWADRVTRELPQPYAVGDYTFGVDAFSVGKYGDLVCRPILRSLDTKKAA